MQRNDTRSPWSWMTLFLASLLILVVPIGNLFGPTYGTIALVTLLFMNLGYRLFFWRRHNQPWKPILIGALLVGLIFMTYLLWLRLQ